MKLASAIRSQTAGDRLLFWTFCGMFFFIPLATSPAVIMGIMTLSVWIFSGELFRDAGRAGKREWAVPVLAFMLLPLAGLIWSQNRFEGLAAVVRTYNWLFALAAAALPFSQNRMKTLVDFFIAGLAVNSLVAILQSAGVVPMYRGAACGFMNHIEHSLFLVLGLLILSFYCRISTDRKRRALYIVLMAGFFLSLAIGIGRSGYLAFAVLSPVMLYNFFGRKHLKRIVAGVLILAVALLSSGTVRNRIKLAVREAASYKSQDEESRETSIGLRLYMWDGAMRIFLARPLFGAGTNGYKHAMMKYKNDPRLPDPDHPHNSFLYMAANFGVVGLLSFFWLLRVYFRKAWYAKDTVIGFFVLSYGLILIIGSLTDTMIVSGSTTKLFALLTGINTVHDAT
jgi:O-antigen ligase